MYVDPGRGRLSCNTVDVRPGTCSPAVLAGLARRPALWAVQLRMQPPNTIPMDDGHLLAISFCQPNWPELPLSLTGVPCSARTQTLAAADTPVTIQSISLSSQLFPERSMFRRFPATGDLIAFAVFGCRWRRTQRMPS